MPRLTKTYPVGAKVLVDGEREATVKDAYPEGSTSCAHPHYKLVFVGGGETLAVPWARVGTVRKPRKPRRVHATRSVTAGALCGVPLGRGPSGPAWSMQRSHVTCSACLDVIDVEDKASPCADCKLDPGACSECEGTGGDPVPCSTCHGKADCPTCNGTAVDPDFERFS